MLFPAKRMTNVHCGVAGLNALSCRYFENFTVMASALVAELEYAPGSDPGAHTGMQVRFLPSALGWGRW